MTIMEAEKEQGTRKISVTLALRVRDETFHQAPLVLFCASCAHRSRLAKATAALIDLVFL